MTLIEELSNGEIIELVLAARGSGTPVPLLLVLESDTDAETAASWVATALTIPHPANPLTKVNIFGRREEFGHLKDQALLSDADSLTERDQAWLHAVSTILHASDDT